MHSKLSIAQTLIHQLGPFDEAIASIVQDEIDSWTIFFNNGQAIHLQFEPEPTQWLMSCELALSSEAHRLAIYTAMLNFNLLYQGVAPLKVALSSPDGNLLLIGQYQLSEHSLPILQQLMQQFLLAAQHVTEQVALHEQQAVLPEMSSQQSPQFSAQDLA
ncbi:MAG: type III secretion system chaperone [Burkholderiaceae bacterium]